MLHGDYKDVKGIKSTKACAEYVKIGEELTKFRASPEVKAATALIRKAESQKKKLRAIILNDLKGVDKLKFEVTVGKQHRDACDFETLKVVKTTVRDVLKRKEEKIA